MKMLTFNDRTTEKIYHYYIKKVKRVSKSLSEVDKDDIMMEINSHIFEAMQHIKGNSDVSPEELLDILDRLGEPDEILKPMIAEKKLRQATSTFNPLLIGRALIMNLGNGITYVIFALLYLSLFAFIFLIGAKITYPKEVGLFFKDNSFYVLGLIAPESRQSIVVHEVLGNWFIPVILLVVIVLYTFITFLLRLFKKKGR